MKLVRLWSWIALGAGALFYFLPLIATFEFSLRARRGVYSLDAYANVLGDAEFQATFGYSVLVALATIALGVAIVAPTAFWIRLKLPRLRPPRM